jgi:Matrixin
VTGLALLFAIVGLPGASAPVQSTSAQSLTITYFIGEGKGSDGYRAADRQLAQWALEAWQRSVPSRVRFEAAAETQALIRVYWTEPNDGRYGETRPVAVGGKSGAAVFIQPDVTLLDPSIARRAAGDDLLRDTIVYLTCLHELGHALGLPHTRAFADIMYYFGYGGDIVEYFDRYRRQLRTRTDIAHVTGLSEQDVTRVRAIFGSP